MKKNYLIFCFCVITFCNKINAQVTLIDDNHSLSGYPIFSNSIFLESDADSTLWTSDGTLSGTKQYAYNVKIDEGFGAGFLNNKFYFAGIDAAHGSELWVTDGTAAGTKLVLDMLPGTTGSSPDNFFLYKSNLYFTDSTSAGRQLYRISGSDGSVSLFKTINPSGNAFTGDNADFFSNNNLLYFTADDGTHGTELWVSDGTAANTKMLKDITTGGSSNFGQFTSLGNLVIFTVTTPFSSPIPYSMDLWKTDGTTTTLIKSFGIALSGAGGFGLLPFNNKIYFGGTDATHGTELWSTDGSTASMVKDINAGTESSSPFLFNSVYINNHFIFSATDAHGTELWSSDGTAANTVMVKDINPGNAGSNPIIFPVFNYSNILNEGSLYDFYQRGTLLNGYIYFQADDGVNGTQLWKTNGTNAGTVLVKAIGGTSGGISDGYFYTKTGLYFSADDGTHGIEPWFTDGTSLNTQMVADINPGSGSSDPEFSFAYNGYLYLTADNGNSSNNYTDLYKINATATVLPVRLINFKATLQKEAVKLDWTTATEVNSLNFTIQRSIDGTNFSDIGTVDAAGNSTVEQAYTFNDETYLSAGANVLFYRLRLNDKDGNYTFSQVQSVTLNGSATDLRIYPNPVHDQLNVIFSTASAEPSALKITDNYGKLLFEQKYSSGTSSRLQNINVSAFAKGTYFVQLISGSENKTIKFVKQ